MIAPVKALFSSADGHILVAPLSYFIKPVISFSQIFTLYADISVHLAQILRRLLLLSD